MTLNSSIALSHFTIPDSFRNPYVTWCSFRPVNPTSRTMKPITFVNFRYDQWRQEKGATRFGGGPLQSRLSGRMTDTSGRNVDSSPSVEMAILGGYRSRTSWHPSSNLVERWRVIGRTSTRTVGDVAGRALVSYLMAAEQLQTWLTSRLLFRWQRCRADDCILLL